LNLAAKDRKERRKITGKTEELKTEKSVSPSFPDGLRTALDGLPDGFNLKNSP
jgi:hypothetical protein